MAFPAGFKETERALRDAELRLRMAVRTPPGVLTLREHRGLLERGLAELERRAASGSAPAARRVRAGIIRLLFQVRRGGDVASLKRPVLRLLDRLARPPGGEFRFARRDAPEDLGSAG